MDLSLIPRAFLLAALAFTDSALAAAQAPLDPQEQEQIQDGLSGPELKESPPPVKEQRQAPIRERLLDEPHDFLSRRVEAYSRKLDDFFSDPNRAYERDIKNATGSTQVAAPGAPQDNNYYLGLKALAAEVFGVALSAEAGAKFARPIDPYIRLRAFRDFNFSQWQIRASETPLWKHSEGYSAASEVNFTRPLDELWQLRFTSKATWRSTTSYFDLAHIGALYYTPGPRTATTFELGAFAPSDRSLKLAAYSVTLRVRRQIYRDWLYLEVTPQILYQEANGFSATRSLMLNLETLFGDRYL